MRGKRRAIDDDLCAEASTRIYDALTECDRAQRNMGGHPQREAVRRARSLLADALIDLHAAGVAVPQMPSADVVAEPITPRRPKARKKKP